MEAYKTTKPPGNTQGSVVEHLLTGDALDPRAAPRLKCHVGQRLSPHGHEVHTCMTVIDICNDTWKHKKTWKVL